MQLETLEYLHMRVSELTEANESQGLEFPYSGDAPLRMKRRLAQCRTNETTDKD